MTRWFPGVLQAIVEEVKSRSSVSKTLGDGRSNGKSVRSILAFEASKTLENTRNIQIAATKEKTLDEIKKDMGIPLDSTAAEAASPTVPTVTGIAGALPPPNTTRRRVRQKMRSTPVVGGSLFDDVKPSRPEEPEVNTGGSSGRQPFSGGLGGQTAELVVGGEVFKIRIMPETIHRIRSGYSGELLDDASVKFSQADVPIEHRLEGFIRVSGLQTISEDVSETASNHGSDKNSEKDADW